MIRHDVCMIQALYYYEVSLARRKTIRGFNDHATCTPGL